MDLRRTRALSGRICAAVLFQRNLHLAIPLLGRLEANIVITPGTWVAMGSCLLGVVLLYRRITSVGRLSKWLWGGVLLTLAWVISAGVTHFHAAQAFDFPPGAFALSTRFFTGLGAAMLITTYDYWGYYNICYLAGEVREAGAKRSARRAHFDFAGGGDLSADERQRARRYSLAGACQGQLRRRRALVGDFRSSCSRFTAAGPANSSPC